MSVGVVVVAAGIGRRMDTADPKQFLLIQNKPILVHTLRVFQTHPQVHHIVVVVRSIDMKRVEIFIKENKLDKVSHVVVGGNSRQQSVCNGLAKVSAKWVLVHDGVRPFVTHEDISELLRVVKKEKAAVLGVPLKNTIKIVDSNQMIISTPERNDLREVQTPQAFCKKLLESAHARYHCAEATDDSLLVEKLGVKVKVVTGSYSNIKITEPIDLLWAEVMLKSRL